jgi:hypothetical protein
MALEIEQKTKKHFLMAVIVLASMVVAIISLQIVVMKMKQNVVMLRAELIAARGQDVATLRRAIREYEENAKILDVALIGREEAVLFIEDLQRLADRANVESTVQSIELFDITETGERVKAAPGTITAERVNGELHVNMVTTGTWSSAMTYLLYIETIPHHVVVKNMRMSSSYNEETKQNTWATVFQLKVTTE